MYFRLILFALGTIFLLCRTCSAAQIPCGDHSTQAVENLYDACGKSHQLQITDAYLCQDKHLRRCDRDCKPRAKTDYDALCSQNKNTSGPRCKARLYFTELNEFYDAADRGKLSLRVFDKQFRNRSGDYHVSYTCADGTRPAAINPCRSLTVINPAVSFRSILVIPDKRSEACVKTCTLQPTMEQVELQYHVLLKENTNTESNFLEMKAVFNNGLATEWKRLDNSYFNAFLMYLNVREMKVRFHVADVARVTRLWLSMKGGTQFSLSCTYEDTNPGTTDTTQSDQEQQKNNDGHKHTVCPVPCVVGSGAGFVAVVVAINLVVCLVRKRKRPCAKMWSQQEPQRASHNAETGHNEHYYSEVLPGSNEAQYMEVLPDAEQSFTEDSLGYLEPRINVLASNYDTADVARSTDVHVYTSLL